MESNNYVAIFSENVEGKYTINRYYFVINGEKYRVDGENLKILKSILKEFECTPSKNNPKIYTQFDEIMYSFKAIDTENKIKKLKKKKVNRTKSRAIKVAIFWLTLVLLTSLSVALGGKKRKNHSKVRNDTSISTELNMEIDTDKNTEENVVIVDSEESLDNFEKFQDIDGYVLEDSEIIEEVDDDDDNIIVFEYESDETFDSQNIENALRYKDLFIKYGDMYGIPWQLLCAMAAQENAGIHDADYREPAIGIMQIERDALIGHTFNKLYNFKTNSFEKFTITNNNGQLEDVNYNIKCGAIELADCIRVSYNIAVKEGKIDIKDGISYATQRYNMGGTNMTRTVENDGDWIKNRDFIPVGDSRYFEKIFYGMQQLGCDTICVKYYDEEAKEVREVKTKIVNTYDKKLSK